MRLVREKAAQAGLRLEENLVPDLPRLHADRAKFKQILVNLVSNGIKFTPTGGTVSVRAVTDAEGRITISVRNTGIGINPAGIDNVLLPFEQEDKDLSRRYQGSELGLPLTKALVEAHGGQLRLESKLGAETTVTIVFPIERTIPLASNPPATEVPEIIA